MAGAAKPSGVQNEGTWKMWNYNAYDPCENLFNGFIGNGYSPQPFLGTYIRPTADCLYDYGLNLFNDTNMFLDIELYQMSNIWAAVLAGYNSKIVAYSAPGGVKGGAVQTSPVSPSVDKEWYKAFSNLPAGRYKICLEAMGQHCDYEWFIESLASFSLTEQNILIPSFDTSQCGGIAQITVTDSSSSAVDCILAENMVDGGSLGTGKLWTKVINMHGTKIEVI